jgi:hypothetical protein
MSLKKKGKEERNNGGREEGRKKHWLAIKSETSKTRSI